MKNELSKQLAKNLTIYIGTKLIIFWSIRKLITWAAEQEKNTGIPNKIKGAA